jgi:DNA-binding response OmpR family regulator
MLMGVSMSHGLILIVEDDPSIRDLLRHIIEDEGFMVVAVDNGYDAVTAATLRDPSVILLDLNLPFLSGEGVIAALQQKGVTAPVLLVTSDPRGERIALSDGVAGHVAKPFDIEELLLSVRVAVMDGMGHHDMGAHDTTI